MRESTRSSLKVIGATLTLILLLLLAAMLTGCTGTTTLVRALQKDPAIVVFNVVHPYGNVRLVRVGMRTNEVVTVSPDGVVSVKSTSVP